ncbi:MAG: PspC domain-containing protein [Flavobacteriales bacterium]
MNKTVSVNLNGLLFNIEEAGYDLLFDYLQKIKAYFRNMDGGEEILQDIEARIAELFTEKLTLGRQVVTLRDVEVVMAVMGKPEDYAGEEDNVHEHFNKTEGSTNNAEKRLYRDPDDRILGGVCSGIANYFGFERTILRLIFALMAIFGGTGVILYIILWIVVPKAKSTADKLRMKGEPVNVENIQKRILDDISRIGVAIEDAAKETEQKWKKNKTSDRISDFANELADGLARFIKLVLKIFGRFLGAFFLLFGLILFFAGIIFVFGHNFLQSGIGNAISTKTIFSSFFSTTWQSSLAFYGIALLLITPAIGLLLSGLRLLMFPKMRLKIPSTINGLLFFTGIIFVSTSAMFLISDFSAKAKVIESINMNELQPDTLLVEMSPESKLRLNKYVRLKSYEFYFNDDEQFVFGKINLNVDISENNNFELKVEKSSRGNNKEQAADEAEMLRFAVEQTNNTLILQPFFKLRPNAKWRAQRADFTLYVPKGKYVKLNKNLRPYLDEVNNNSDLSARSSAGHLFVAENEALRCIDCENKEE